MVQHKLVNREISWWELVAQIVRVADGHNGEMQPTTMGRDWAGGAWQRARQQRSQGTAFEDANHILTAANRRGGTPSKGDILTAIR